MCDLFSNWRGHYLLEDELNIKNIDDIKKDNSVLESLLFKINKIFTCNSKLKSLPDISKWDTSNLKYIRNMFLGCSSLTSLPDISKWKTNKIKKISYLF